MDNGNMWMACKFGLLSTGIFTTATILQRSSFATKWSNLPIMVGLLGYPITAAFLIYKEKRRLELEASRIRKYPKLLRFIKHSLVDMQPMPGSESSSLDEDDFMFNDYPNHLGDIKDGKMLNTRGLNETKRLYLEMFSKVLELVHKYEDIVKKRNERYSSFVMTYMPGRIIFSIVDDYVRRIDNFYITLFIFEYNTPDYNSYTRKKILFGRISRAYYYLIEGGFASEGCGVQAEKLRKTLHGYK